MTYINSNTIISPLHKSTQLQHPNNKVIGSTLPNGTLAYTVAELAKAPLFVQFEIDDHTSRSVLFEEVFLINFATKSLERDKKIRKILN